MLLDDAHLSESYVAPSASAAASPAKARTARASRCERERVSRAFDEAVRAKGWTNGQVARRLGVDERYVRRLRAGERYAPEHRVALGLEL